MKKRGELTTQQIVTLIILIASFAVILYFIFGMKLFSNQEKDICHNSVLMRANSLIPDEAAPLNCKRSYVCISADKTCEMMSNPVLHKVKTKNETFEVLAEELADCWWMFGEGKINYAGKELIQKWYCAQCAQIAFDDSMKEIFPEGKFSEEELYGYLVSTNLPRSEESYASYLYKTEDILIAAEEFDISFREIFLDKQYYVLTAMHSQLGGLETSGAAAAAGAVFVIIPQLRVLKGVAKLGALVSKKTLTGAVGVAGLGKLVTWIIPGESGGNQIPPSLIEAPSSSEEFQDLNCKALTTYA